MSQCIAERQLLYSSKDSVERHPITVRILQPTVVDATDVTFLVAPSTGECIVEVHGLPKPVSERYYGADTLQALQLAADVEPLLKRFTREFDFFFPTGEGYFDE